MFNYISESVIDALMGLGFIPTKDDMTYEDVVNWIRKVFNIDITNMPSTYKHQYFYEIYNQTTEEKIVSEDYDTYEESLINSVWHAINLLAH